MRANTIGARRYCLVLRVFPARGLMQTIASAKASFTGLIYVTLNLAAVGETFQWIFQLIALRGKRERIDSETRIPLNKRSQQPDGEFSQPRRALKGARPQRLASIRVSSGSYLALAAVMTFGALVCLRTQRDLPALIIIFSTWTTIPILIFSDRLTFDGLTLRRTGLSALIQTVVFRRSLSLSVANVERVEVASLRTLRRGGNVRYRYRVDVVAGESTLTFSSGPRFRRMTQALLTRIAEHKLDARACELRDHLVEPRAVRVEAERLGIASSAVLENASETVKIIEKRRR